MGTSTYRIKKQWVNIVTSINKREDFVPFNFGEYVYVTVGTEKRKVLSRRDFVKKMNTFSQETGGPVDFDIEYKIDFNSLVDAVENRVARLLSTDE